MIRRVSFEQFQVRGLLSKKSFGADHLRIGQAAAQASGQQPKRQVRITGQGGQDVRVNDRVFAYEHGDIDSGESRSSFRVGFLEEVPGQEESASFLVFSILSKSLGGIKNPSPWKTGASPPDVPLDHR